jgi:hypothetical protein
MLCALSDDPDFETKAVGAIGLYLTPPQHAALFCVDEKNCDPSAGSPRSVLPCCPADWNGTVMSVAATACYLCMRHWT